MTSSGHTGERAIHSSDFSAFTKRSHCPSLLRFLTQLTFLRSSICTSATASVELCSPRSKVPWSFATVNRRVRVSSFAKTHTVSALSAWGFHHPEQGRRGLSFTVEGAAASRPSRNPISGMSFLTRHSDSSVALPSLMGASTRGNRCGFSAQFEPVTLFSLEKIPPFRRGSPDISKQRLQGLCSTTGTFLPPTERSNRGSTAVGSRTRVLQPLLPRSKEGRRLEAYSGSTAFEFFPLQREVLLLTMRTIMSQVQEGDWFVTIDLKDVYFHIQVVQRHRRFLRFAFGGKAYQYKVLPCGLALAPRTFTKCMDAALAPLRLQGIRVLNWMTGSFWLTPGS